MPYYRHRSTDEPTAAPLGTYTSAQEAHQAKEPGESVTFVESDEERENWTERERERFDRGEYVPAPFYTLNTTSLHFVHLSRKHPGQIAFTKTTEHGVQDRQTIMRPGRYLEEFFKYEDGTPAYQDFWPTWIAQCSASAVTYAIATTADDIETVYRYGPRSCMSDEGGGPFRGQPHPTRVYGESDLSLAYMGPKEHATARALIWPEKKVLRPPVRQPRSTCASCLRQTAIRTPTKATSRWPAPASERSPTAARSSARISTRSTTSKTPAMAG